MRPIGEAAVREVLRADMGSDGSAAGGGVKRPERVAGVGKAQACCVRRSGCRGPQQDIRPYTRYTNKGSVLPVLFNAGLRTDRKTVECVNVVAVFCYKMEISLLSYWNKARFIDT